MGGIQELNYQTIFNMTANEAIRALCSISVPSGNLALITTDVIEALSMAIDALRLPPLPEGLDEAAEESARKWRKNPDGSESRELFFQPHIRGFKAGAEWMAGQVVTFETEVYESYTGKPIIEEITESFIPGDKVIVQVRKK